MAPSWFLNWWWGSKGPRFSNLGFLGWGMVSTVRVVFGHTGWHLGTRACVWAAIIAPRHKFGHVGSYWGMQTCIVVPRRLFGHTGRHFCARGCVLLAHRHWGACWGIRVGILVPGLIFGARAHRCEIGHACRHACMFGDVGSILAPNRQHIWAWGWASGCAFCHAGGHFVVWAHIWPLLLEVLFFTYS